MGRKATGSIKHRNGKSLAFLRDEYLGTYPNDAAAQERIDAALEMDAGRVADSLAAHGEAWMKDRDEAGETRGMAEEWSVWTNHVEPAPFYDRPAKTVTARDVTKYLRTLARKPKTRVRRAKGAADGHVRITLDEPLGPQTVKHARRLLRQAFQVMVDDGIIPANPVLGAKLPKTAEVEEENEEWSFCFVEEVAALFAAIEAIVPGDARARARMQPRTLARLEQRRCFYRAVYALAVYGGLRQGEIFGLDWGDIYFEARGVGDRSNSVRVRRTRMGLAPKSESSKRWVPMLPPLRAALEAWRTHGGVIKVGKVFPADGAAGQGHAGLGGYFGRSYDAAWNRRFRALATPRDYVTFHDLRHTCASHLIMGSWGLPLTPLEVAEWLGHSDLKTTQRYMHLAPGALEELVAKMGRGVTKAEAARRAELTRRAAIRYAKR